AAPELAERALEGLHARLERRQDVGEPLAAGVVEVRGQLDARQPLTGLLEEVAHLAGVRHPRRIPERNLLAAGVCEPFRDLEDPGGRNLPLVRAPEGDRDDSLAPQRFATGA